MGKGANSARAASLPIPLQGQLPSLAKLNLVSHMSYGVELPCFPHRLRSSVLPLSPVLILAYHNQSPCKLLFDESPKSPCSSKTSSSCRRKRPQGKLSLALAWMRWVVRPCLAFLNLPGFLVASSDSVPARLGWDVRAGLGCVFTGPSSHYSLPTAASCCGDLNRSEPGERQREAPAAGGCVGLLGVTPDFVCWRNESMHFFCLTIRNFSGMRQ